MCASAFVRGWVHAGMRMQLCGYFTRMCPALIADALIVEQHVRCDDPTLAATFDRCAPVRACACVRVCVQGVCVCVRAGMWKHF